MGVGSLAGPLITGAISHAFSVDLASLAIGAISVAGAAWYATQCEESLGFAARTDEEAASKPMLGSGS